MKNYTFYHPLTANPFKKNISYAEFAPCKALLSYIRCFWGSEKPILQVENHNQPEIVIPDTCVDIIYNIDYTDNKVTGGFYGINDHSFYVPDGEKKGHLVSTFAIRFFAWSAYVFADDSLKSTLNGYFEVGSRFEWLDRIIRPKLMEMKSFQERAAFVEQLLLHRLLNIRENSVVENTMQNILINRGTIEVTELADRAFISTRQLERLFHEYLGITPKKLSNLIRYQFLWSDIIYMNNFDILDAVHKYGYTDQSHLLREFKRYHSMDIRTAKAVACNNVENIQDVI